MKRFAMFGLLVGALLTTQVGCDDIEIEIDGFGVRPFLGGFGGFGGFGGPGFFGNEVIIVEEYFYDDFFFDPFFFF